MPASEYTEQDRANLVDMPPDDPEHEDTLSTSYDHLVLVLNRRILGIE